VAPAPPVTVFNAIARRALGTCSCGVAAGQKVTVDYTVEDWRWLMQTDSASTQTSKQNPPYNRLHVNSTRVKLAVPNLAVIYLALIHYTPGVTAVDIQECYLTLLGLAVE
jgi:hypothetical protein